MVADKVGPSRGRASELAAIAIDNGGARAWLDRLVAISQPGQAS